MYVRNPPRCTQEKMRDLLSVFVFKKEHLVSIILDHSTNECN